MGLRGQDTAVSSDPEFAEILFGNFMLSIESSIYDLGNMLKPSAVRESCGDSRLTLVVGWVGGRTVMAVGGGVRIDSGESLHSFQGTPLFQLLRSERSTLISWLQKLVPLGTNTSQ